MSQVDREATVPLDPTAEVSDVHDRFRDVVSAFKARLGELALTGATPAEKLGLREARDHLAGIELLAQTAVTAIDETDVPLRASAEETLAGDAAYAVVQQFVDRAGGGFTLAQLKEHLRSLGYELPNNSKAFSRQFADWQQRILEQKTNPQGEDVRPERRRWVKLGARKYVLAWLEAPPAKTTWPKPASQPAPAELPPRTAVDAPADPAPVPTAEPAPEPSVQPERLLRLVPSSTPEEDVTSAAALRMVREASGEPAKALIGQLIKEMNMTAPAARQVFEDLARGGHIHRYSAAGRVRYSAEPPEPRASAASAPATSVTEAASESSAEVSIQTAEQVLGAFIGRSLSFGTALSPQEIARKIVETNEGSDITADDVKTAANYLWSLGFVTRVEAQGRLKLQLADRSIMTALKSEQARAAMLDLVATGKAFTPPTEPARRRPVKKKR